MTALTAALVCLEQTAGHIHPEPLTEPQLLPAQEPHRFVEFCKPELVISSQYRASSSPLQTYSFFSFP